MHFYSAMISWGSNELTTPPVTSNFPLDCRQAARASWHVVTCQCLAERGTRVLSSSSWFEWTALGFTVRKKNWKKKKKKKNRTKTKKQGFPLQNKAKSWKWHLKHKPCEEICSWAYVFSVIFMILLYFAMENIVFFILGRFFFFFFKKKKKKFKREFLT